MGFIFGLVFLIFSFLYGVIVFIVGFIGMVFFYFYWCFIKRIDEIEKSFLDVFFYFVSFLRVGILFFEVLEELIIVKFGVFIEEFKRMVVEINKGCLMVDVLRVFVFRNKRL